MLIVKADKGLKGDYINLNTSYVNVNQMKQIFKSLVTRYLNTSYVNVNLPGISDKLVNKEI